MLDGADRRLDEVREVSLADRARESIREAILSGAIRPGERVTIEQLAAELGVSRTPVREALKALEGDGVVRLLPHRGVVVEPVAVEELYHRYEIRAMLEGYAAELACHADSARIAAELEANCDQLDGLIAHATTDDQVRRLAELNQAFHAIIREGSGSRTLARLLDTLRNPVRFTLAYWGDPGRRRTSLEIHREIAAAFRADRPKLARRLAERHLLDARKLVIVDGDHLAPTATSAEMEGEEA